MNESERGTRNEKLAAVDHLVCLALFVAALAYYVAHERATLWGDGIPLFQEMELVWRSWRWLHYHAAYIPTAKLFALLHPSEVTYHGYVLASSVPCALTVALGFASSRLLGVSRTASVMTAALFGAAPFMAFFATTLEVHGLHAGAVAFALWSSLLLGRIRRTAVFLAAHALLFAPIAASHTTALLLVPGWAIWQTFVVARQRPDLVERWGLARVLTASCAAAVVVFAATLAVIEVSWRVHGMGSSTAFMAGTVQEHLELVADLYLWEEWIVPLAWAVPFVVGACVVCALTRERPRFSTANRGVTLVCLVATLPAFIGFNIWSVRFNMGGYVCGVAPFLVLAVAAVDGCWRSRRAQIAWRLALAFAALAQLFTTTRALDARSAAEDLARPALFDAALERLPRGGALLTFEDPQWNVATMAPGWSHLDLNYLLRMNPDGSYQRDIRVFIEQRLVKGTELALLDVSFQEPASGIGNEHGPRIEAFMQVLEDMFVIEPVADAAVPLAVLRPR